MVGEGCWCGGRFRYFYRLICCRKDGAKQRSGFVCGVVTGVVFGTAAGMKIASMFDATDLLSPIEISLMGATAASLFSWWGLGMIARLSAQYRINPASRSAEINRSNNK